LKYDVLVSERQLNEVGPQRPKGRYTGEELQLVEVVRTSTCRFTTIFNLIWSVLASAV